MEPLHLLIIFSTIIAASQSQSIVIDVASPYVLLGDDATIRCTVHNYQPGLFIHWVKRQGDEEVQVGTNSFLNDEFKELERYSTEMYNEGDTMSFLLNIRGVHHEDSGDFGCYIPMLSTGTRVYESLTVTVPVQDVRLFALNDPEGEPVYEYTDGEMVKFEHGDQYYFVCTATGSSPAATFDITLHGESVLDSFVRSEVSYPDGEGSEAMRKTLYDVTMKTAEPVTVDFTKNSLEFRCAASVPGQEPGVAVQIVPELKFAPVIECNPVHVPSYLLDITINCTVRADPPIDTLRWHWKIIEGADAEINLLPGHREGQYRVTQRPGETADSVITELHIDRAFLQTFRAYEVIASNIIGESKGTVLLERDLSLEPMPSGSSTIYVYSSWMLVMVIASLIALICS